MLHRHGESESYWSEAMSLVLSFFDLDNVSFVRPQTPFPGCFHGWQKVPFAFDAQLLWNLHWWKYLASLSMSSLSLYRESFTVMGVGLIAEGEGLLVLLTLSNSIFLLSIWSYSEATSFPCLLHLTIFYCLILEYHQWPHCCAATVLQDIPFFFIKREKTFAYCFNIIRAIFTGVSPCLAVIFTIIKFPLG